MMFREQRGRTAHAPQEKNKKWWIIHHLVSGSAFTSIGASGISGGARARSDISELLGHKKMPDQGGFRLEAEPHPTPSIRAIFGIYYLERNSGRPRFW